MLLSTLRPFARSTSLGALALAALSAAPAAAQTSKVGDTPSHAFRSELLNGQGIKSLEDLRGRPVLVDFWGTNCPPCIAFAVPSALELAAEYGEDLVVLLVEVQGASHEGMRKFTLGKKWLGTNAMWTTERPFRLGFEGIPHSALISPEGEIVMAGYTTEIHSKLEEKVAELVSAAKGAPAGTPKSLKKAWQVFAKGQYGKALAEARALQAEGGEDAALAGQTLTTFVARIGREIDRAQWRLENGYPIAAKGRLEGLARELKGEELAARVDGLLGRFAEPTVQQELDAEGKLAKIEQKLYEEGPDARYEKMLRKLAAEHAGTRVCERATSLADAVAGA